MELTPSFKVKVLKEWSDLNGYYHLCIDWIIRSINWVGRCDGMERKWISSTILLIYNRINGHFCNDIYTKQRLDVDIANPSICPATYISGCRRITNKWKTYVQSSYHSIHFPLYTYLTCL